MVKVTVLLSLILISLSLTSGNDFWKNKLQKRIARDSQAFNHFFGWWPTPPIRTWPTFSTTAKVTTTTSKTKVTTTTTSSSSSSSFTTFQNQILAQTNKYRAAHCAPNLQLDATLNTVAQNYAQTLLSKGYLVHSNNDYGENLYSTSISQASSVQGSTVVDAWYNEVSDYNWSSPGFSPATGHFTQLVWINSKKLGVGIACASGKGCYIVANYDPPGNYANQYQANVKPKSSCK